MPKNFDIPFANGGDKTVVPVPTQAGGSVSYNQGWGPDYELDQVAFPVTAKDVDRRAENQLKFDITEALKEIEQTGILLYDASFNYLINAFSQGSDGVLYQALALNGPDTTIVNPATDTSGLWLPYLPASSNREGLQVVRDSGFLLTTLPGRVLNQARTTPIVLRTNLQKEFPTTWAEGNGGGVVAAGAGSGTDIWVSRFLVRKPNGVTDIVWDSDPAAANFFASGVAIAAGFSDATLYKQYGQTFINSGVQIEDFTNDENDPSLYRWPTQKLVYDVATLSSGVRATIDMTLGVPPDAIARLGIYVQFGGGGSGNRILITTADQNDVPATSTMFTILTQGSPRVANLVGEWKADSSSQIFAVRGGSDVIQFAIFALGWIDSGIT